MEFYSAWESYPGKSYILNSQLQLLTDLVGYESFIERMEKWAIHEMEGDFLEIGCFVGGGTAKLAKAAGAWGKKVYAVDIFEPSSDKTVNLSGASMAELYSLILGGREQESLFYENIEGLDNVVVLKMDTRNLCFDEGQKFVFAFLDGNHDPEMVRNDFEKVWPLVVSGGVLGFHDYGGDLPATTGAIDEILAVTRSEISHIEVIPAQWVLLLFKK